jgi:hypothetical protein
VGDGSTNRFYFGFDYINKQFVKVQVGADSSPLTYLTDYTVDDRSVTLTDTPDVGIAIRVYRETPSDRIVEWADGAFIKASQMTLENLQQLHLIEEAQDYPILSSLSRYPDGVNFNALNSRITGVKDPTDPQDVVTKHYMETVQGGFVSQNTALVQEATKQAFAAKASQESSKTSEINAKTSETNSEIYHQNAKKWAEATESPDGEADMDSTTGKTQSSRSWALYSKTKAQESATFATNAKSSETKAKTSETNAKTSETNAKTSETNAKTSETKALTSEQKAKTSEINAKTAEDDAGIYSGSAYSSYIKAQAWAESTESPDGEYDSLSTTGKTKSAKEWAKQAKEYAGSLNLSFIINAVLPVGAIIEFINDTDPNELYPGTTWIKMDAGRVLISSGTYTENGTTYTYNLYDKGGEAKHQITIEEMAPHTHGASMSTAGKHSHTYLVAKSAGSGNSADWSDHAGGDWPTSVNGEHSHQISINNTGGGNSHENRQPYQVINRWRRID